MKKQYPSKNINRNPVPKSTGSAKPIVKPLSNKPDFKPYYVLFIFVFALYANSLVNQYALDDRLTITENKFTTQGIKGIDDILSNDTFVGFFGKQKNLVAGGRYRPASLITFALEYEAFGLSPFVSHLVNLLLYAFACLLIYKVLLMLFSPPDKNVKWYLSIPFLATMLFIAHPLHVEGVANIKGRDEIMSLLGSIAAFYFVLRYVQGKKFWLMLLAAVSFFIGLMSKENAITFLVVIPMSLYFFKKSELKPAVISTAFLFFVTVVFIFIRYRVLGFLMGGSIEAELLNNPFIEATTSQKFATILLTWGKYLALLIFPHPLTHDYYPKQIPIIEMSDIRAIIPFIVYVAMILYAIVKIGKRDIIAYGILFFGLTFSISSNLVFPIGTFMNDRFMFIPLLGFTLIIAYFLNKLLRRSGEKPLVVVMVIILLAYSVKTISRNPVWYDDYTLFTTDVKVSGNSAKCNVSAGGQTLELAEKESDQVKKKAMISDAMVFLNKGISIHPKYTAGWVLLGRAMLDLEDYSKAREYYKIALTYNSAQSEALNNWLYCAQQSSKNKDYMEAEISYKELIKYQKANDDLYVQLATVYETDKKTDSAIAMLDTVLKKNPKYAPALSKMGEIYGKVLNNIDKSLEYMLKAYAISPTDASLLENLGIAYGIKKDFEQSIAFFEKAIAADPDNPAIYTNMYSTYSIMGNKDKAAECLKKATELQNKKK
jgi:protein O-mannosyl-transferase